MPSGSSVRLSVPLQFVVRIRPWLSALTVRPENRLLFMTNVCGDPPPRFVQLAGKFVS